MDRDLYFNADETIEECTETRQCVCERAIGASPSNTETPSNTASNSASITSSSTASESASESVSETASASASESASESASITASSSATESASITASPSKTLSASPTVTSASPSISPTHNAQYFRVTSGSCIGYTDNADCLDPTVACDDDAYAEYIMDADECDTAAAAL